MQYYAHSTAPFIEGREDLEFTTVSMILLRYAAQTTSYTQASRKGLRSIGSVLECVWQVAIAFPLSAMANCLH